MCPAVLGRSRSVRTDRAGTPDARSAREVESRGGPSRRPTGAPGHRPAVGLRRAVAAAGRRARVHRPRGPDPARADGGTSGRGQGGRRQRPDPGRGSPSSPGGVHPPRGTTRPAPMHERAPADTRSATRQASPPRYPSASSASARRLNRSRCELRLAGKRRCRLHRLRSRADGDERTRGRGHPCGGAEPRARAGPRGWQKRFPRLKEHECLPSDRRGGGCPGCRRRRGAAAARGRAPRGGPGQHWPTREVWRDL